MASIDKREFTKIKEVVSSWSQVRQLLRTGDQGDLVPVVIPKDNRGFGWLGIMGIALYFASAAIFLLLFSESGTALGCVSGGIALLFLLIGGAQLRSSAIVNIEQGTIGILSRYGKFEETLPPGLKFLIWPWEKIEYIVDTSTEIPYTAPVLACPTQENVPLKSIEFFLKFRITDPVLFVRRIGAGNFDIVLSSMVQDAIRRRSRELETSKAYDLRGSDVGNMQDYLNKQLSRYGVQITGANIPDVQLPDQYRQNLSARERIAKELASYEREWDLMQKRRTDTIMMEIERAKKARDETVIGVRQAVNNAREKVAQMIQERQADAEKIRLDIEAQAQADLKGAENEARALSALGKAYRDNEAVLRYELERRRLAVAEQLLQHVPRPVVINTQGQEGSSPLSTLLMAQLLPGIMNQSNAQVYKPAGKRSSRLNLPGPGSSSSQQQGQQMQQSPQAQAQAAANDKYEEAPDWLQSITSGVKKVLE